MHEPDHPDGAARAGGALTAALRAVADDDADLGASPAIEARLKAELRTLAIARRRRARWSIAALAAAVLVAAAAVFKSEVGSLKSDRTSHFRLQTSTSEVTTAFMPLTYSGVPIADGHLVRMEVPRASLVTMGLAPIDSIDSVPGGTVLADVIVGDDGLARAVRFVRKTARKEQQR